VAAAVFLQFYVQVPYGGEIKLCSDIVIGTVPLHETVQERLPQRGDEPHTREWRLDLVTPRVGQR